MGGGTCAKSGFISSSQAPPTRRSRELELDDDRWKVFPRAVATTVGGEVLMGVSLLPLDNAIFFQNFLNECASGGVLEGVLFSDLVRRALGFDGGGGERTGGSSSSSYG